MKRFRTSAWMLAAGSLLAAAPATAAESDPFLEGYASAVLERDLGVRAESVRVDDGVLTVRVGDLAPERQRAVAETLATIEGVRRVRIVSPDEEPPPPARSTRAAPDEVPAWDFLPPGDLFEPLLADPRWPHFSASYQRYVRSGDELGNVAAVSFGDVISLLRRNRSDGSAWDLALHAGVFSIFDIDADSFDLLNSDFLVGPALSYQRGPLSAMVRLFHQSSHLGDEFLLRRDTDRINLSYEALDALLSWEPTSWLRLYGGGGMLLRREPGDLERASAQLGLEAWSPRTWAGGTLRPVLAVDVHSREESDWEPDVSARLGLQIESPRLADRRLLILLDYFQGRSPNGQFFDREIEYWALGAHLHF